MLYVAVVGTVLSGYALGAIRASRWLQGRRAAIAWSKRLTGVGFIGSALGLLGWQRH